MCQFLLLTGLRVGEASALRWEDIDFVHKFIYVNKSLTYEYINGKKTLKITTPKTDNSVRKVPFFGETQKVLEKQHEKIINRRKEKIKVWRQLEQFGDLVFLTSLGSPVGRHNLESVLRGITKQINEMFGLDIWVEDREDFQDVEEQQNGNEEEEIEYRGGEVVE